MSDAFKLIIEDDEGKRSVVPLDLGQASIGRLDGNTIRLNERNVSRQHARLLRENGSIFAEDLDSYNGVYINGDRVQGRSTVHEGDLIQIGDFHLELRGEGLQRRSEETTQRTVLPDMEATQPEIRVPGQPLPPHQPIEQEPESRPEPTAIIRMDQMQELEETGEVNTIAGKRPKLICVSTNLAGSEYEIEKTEVIMGRSDSDIIIDHRSVSRNHAKITKVGDSYKVVDMGSANGTLVNGEQYAQVDLKQGDLIELGHVKMRFVPPGATYELTEAERAAITSGGAAEGSTPYPPPSYAAPTYNAPAPQTGGGGGFMGAIKANPLAAIAVMGMLVAIGVLVAWIVGSGPKTPAPPIPANPTPPTATPTPTPTAPVADEESLQKHIAKAQQLMQERNWKKAILRLELALEEFADHPDLTALHNQAQFEWEAQKVFDAAQKAVAGSDWEEAWNLLGEIPKGSVYHGDADDIRAQVSDALVLESINNFQQHLEDKDFTAALETLARLESLQPDHPELQNFKDQLKKAQEGGGAAVRNPTRPRPTKNKGQTKRTDPVEAPPPKAAAKGPEDLYAEGAALIKRKMYNEATQKFSKCVQQDRTSCKCYRALGIAYAKLGNGPKAARYYGLYLKFCPNAADADKVRALLEQSGR